MLVVAPDQYTSNKTPGYAAPAARTASHWNTPYEPRPFDLDNTSPRRRPDFEWAQFSFPRACRRPRSAAIAKNITEFYDHYKAGTLDIYIEFLAFRTAPLAPLPRLNSMPGTRNTSSITSARSFQSRRAYPGA